MIQRVYFTGALPQNGHPPFGGGEIGNVRTIRMLESFGYKVIRVRRLRSGVKESWMMRRLTYPFRFGISTLSWLLILMFGHKRQSIAHVSGFYGNTIFIETLQTAIAKFFGYKLVYELRGGGATKFYEEGSKFYRKQFRYIINNADYLLSQGKENEPLLKGLCSTPICYYPNCVQQGFYPSELPKKPVGKINLLFFGRIEKEKNPMLIVETAAILQREYENITLTVIGGGQPKLISDVKKQMEDGLQVGSYTYLPGCEHDELQRLLRDKHFYIFPSVQPREGQSNAVTEAMSFGIIPIASPQGFNRSTIGDEALIVNDLTAKSYAERISSIIQKKEVEKYSQFVRNRFLREFTEECVFDRMRKEYTKIIG